MEDLTKVAENLYISNRHTASNEEILKKAGIVCVLSITRVQIPNHKGFVYKLIDIDDKYYVDIKKYFGECYEYIKENIKKGGCLVHCDAGVSRSATIIISLLMKISTKTLPECFKYVKSKRPIIKPNIGFIQQLLDYEKELRPNGDKLKIHSQMFRILYNYKKKQVKEEVIRKALEMTNYNYWFASTVLRDTNFFTEIQKFDPMNIE